MAGMMEQASREINKVIIGQEKVTGELLVCYFSLGHALIEGVPGTAKTLLVRTLAFMAGGGFRRIQFTPDLMPSDVVGTHIYDAREQSFRLEKGPLFTDFLLADEINRTPPRTQSALLEAMEERQVTIEGDTCPLPEHFMVCATQNPLEFEGTYPLPEAQLDRFMMKITIGYPSFNEEREIVRKHHEGFSAGDLAGTGIQALPADAVKEMREKIAHVAITEPVMDYIVEIVASTRKSRSATMGASPRASVHLLQCSKACAALKGRDYVIPDDIKNMAYAVLRHRIIVRPEAEIEGTSADDIIRGVLAAVNVPR